MSEVIENLLQGQVAIVTGGTRGIGRSIAELFARHGATVVVFGRNAEKGLAAAAAMNQEVGAERVKFQAVDVASTAGVKEAIEAILAEHKKIDVLVNNAGITKDGLLMRMSEEDWDQVIATNLKSIYNTCHAVIRSMMKARSGSIINISSVVGLTGNAGQMNYSAAKSGMIGATKSLAKEVAPRGIRVNCIAPGFVETDMTDALNDKQREEILRDVPMGQLGQPEDIALAALFLASSMARYITGTTLPVDGGMVMY